MDLVREAISHVWACMKVGEDFFKRPFILNSITFGLTGGTAGRVVIRDGRYELQINRELLEANSERMFRQTLPHEVSHVLAFQNFGTRIDPHGEEWKLVMREVFKLKPDRCHSMELPVASRPFAYRCSCRDFFVSERKHARMKVSAHRCNACQELVSFAGRREAKPAIVADKLLIYTGTGRITVEQLKRVRKLLSSAQVNSVVLQGVTHDSEGVIARVARTLSAKPASVRHHPSPSVLPAGCSHAVFFLDAPNDRQKLAFEAMRANGVLLRVLSHSRPG